MGRRVRHMLLWASLAASSCAPARNRELAVQRDSAGILVTESWQTQWAPGEEWRVDPLPIVDLGEAGTGPEYEFFRVRDATRLDDGRIAVANYGTSEVRLYAPDGTYLRTAGRAGQGPGEFERLTSVQPYRGDSILAFDYWAKRLTLLDSSGVVSRVTSLIGQSGSLSDIYAFPDGRFLLHTSAISAMAAAQGRIRIPAPLVRLAPDGSVEDTVATVAGFETYVFDRGDARPPLEHQVHIAVHDSSIYVGEGDVFEVRILDSGGALRRVVRLPDYDLSVPETVRDSMKEAMLQQELPPQLRPTMEAMANSIPSRRPAYSGLRVDAAGYIWAREYTPSTALSSRPMRWLVFDPSGVWMGNVDLPPNFDLYEVGGDYVVGRSRDEMEVETIQVLRLTRS